ncbi:MAG TPA: DNA polymerase IV [Gemmatimonadales bacterium]|nr:DNA polymerase IV [Gemmatimonadales bacterium]
MSARFLHVDLDAFFVEVCRRLRPELRDIDLLIVGGQPKGRGVVQSASYGARKFGVRAGMSSAEAARRCPGATFVRTAFDEYRKASRAVRRVLEDFSPIVVMASLDEGYLDFSGTDRLYPVSLLPVAEQIRDRVLAEEGLACSIGIGGNRMVAKLASDAAKPRGLMEVRAGWEEGFVAGLPLRALPGVGPRTATRLESLGLTEVWQVQARSVEALEKLIGGEAKLLKRRAHGHGGRVLRTQRRTKSMSRETTLDRDTNDPALLERLLLRLSAFVASQLRGEGLAARTVTLKLRHGDFVTITRSQTLEAPSDLDGDITGAARELLRSAFGEVRRRGKGVRLIGVAATNLVEAPMADLFEPPERVRLRQLTTAVDRVRERFGFDAAKAASLVAKKRRGRGLGTED